MEWQIAHLDSIEQVRESVMKLLNHQASGFEDRFRVFADVQSRIVLIQRAFVSRLLDAY